MGTFFLYSFFCPIRTSICTFIFHILYSNLKKTNSRRLYSYPKLVFLWDKDAVQWLYHEWVFRQFFPSRNFLLHETFVRNPCNVKLSASYTDFFFRFDENFLHIVEEIAYRNFFPTKWISFNLFRVYTQGRY